ncbi:ABC transporter ATP-binding protein [Candidatus Bipolaricaulota bacterium]|nr:ABC transporter ATP-binding protein [Candidatus Bipolaricaulota bacterium]
MIINDLSMHVNDGELVSLVGPNGAGKTTLFNLLTGFLKPDSGRVRLDDDDITGLSSHRVFRKGICRTFQIPRELKGMTVVENLMLVPPQQLGEALWNPFLRPRAVRRQEASIRDKAIEVLEFLNLSEAGNQLADTLSGGQKKLLELARTMMTDPRLVLLDEPGAGVNRTLLKRLAEAIRRLCDERGLTFLVIEHDMDFVMQLCSPIVVMSEGGVLMEGLPEDVQRDQRVLDAYLGGQYAVVDS